MFMHDAGALRAAMVAMYEACTAGQITDADAAQKFAGTYVDEIEKRAAAVFASAVPAAGQAIPSYTLSAPLPAAAPNQWIVTGTT